MELLISIIALILGLAAIFSIFTISSNTSKTNELLRELLAMQLIRDDAGERQINRAADTKLISEPQRKYLLDRYRERHNV